MGIKQLSHNNNCILGNSHVVSKLSSFIDKNKINGKILKDNFKKKIDYKIKFSRNNTIIYGYFTDQKYINEYKKYEKKELNKINTKFYKDIDKDGKFLGYKFIIGLNKEFLEKNFNNQVMIPFSTLIKMLINEKGRSVFKGVKYTFFSNGYKEILHTDLKTKIDIGTIKKIYIKKYNDKENNLVNYLIIKDENGKEKKVKIEHDINKPVLLFNKVDLYYNLGSLSLEYNKGQKKSYNNGENENKHIEKTDEEEEKQTLFGKISKKIRIEFIFVDG